MSAESDFISEYRQLVTQWLDVQAQLEEKRVRWDSLNYAEDLLQEHFVGENAEITKGELSDAVSTMGSVTTLLSQGHRTNLYRVIM